ncbi:hypothetical protein M2454_000457 [Aequitasia blattaphilus]|uniref:Vitamin B12 dependent methionine synthase activation subunit n=1 Tax=Aequitasia blattaphilus TaxID=2949332 RepID=A0ABT1E5P3_9FIRM|nr:Vitamin B12 dependent methionine synthase activation subunit [Aequitasia blattaphilus]MCP1101153.1 Vitamin B12 dependent methionine synthase activation subunit [Aequitasia blattaphilus]MCR8613793.1 Vitamin B12 dependent methionine synthase activation subunit [Aequitasia blattaphilus]
MRNYKVILKETIRYMGYGGKGVPKDIEKLAEESVQRVEEVSRFRISAKRFPFYLLEDGKMMLGDIAVCSDNLQKNLENAREVYLFAATLGIEVDRLMKRFSISDMAKVVGIQSGAAALLEYELDVYFNMLKIEHEKEGLYLHQRFSPGYGDFSISHQKEILDRVDAGKRLALTSTEQGMLNPLKSVTGVVGLGPFQKKNKGGKCGECKKRDCTFRK